MIVLEACAGLGNRMYSIASAYHLAQITNQKLLILWNIDNSCKAKADAIFDFPVDMEIIYTTNYSLKHSPLRHLKSKFIKRHYKLAASTVLYSNSISILRNYHNGFAYLCEAASQQELLYIESCYFFLPPDKRKKEYFALFKPSDQVWHKAAPIINKLPKNAIGLHIRRTDHEEAITHGPLQAFIDKIDQHLQNTPSATFFLATDDKETERQLVLTYPNNIIVNPAKQFTRKSTDGIIDAYIDILCLSRCARIIGSYESTFSQIAAILGNVPLEIVDTLA